MPYVWLSIAGAFAGLLGGLLGIGGSSIMLPAMVWVLGPGEEQLHHYQAAAMVVNFLLILPSVLAHARARAIWRGIWLWLTGSAIVCIVAGVYLSFQTRGLKYFVGSFFLYVVAQNLYRLARPAPKEGLEQAQAEALPRWRRLAVGGPMGLVAGLLGIGGGALAVPMQQMLLKMPLRNAIATSAATIAAVSWVGAIAKNVQLHAHGGSVVRALLLAAALAPTAMIGSYLGGRLTHVLPVRVTRAAFMGLMLLAAAKMFGWI